MGMKGEILINTENDQLLTAKESLEEKNRFLEENQCRILKLTGKIWKKNISLSDDEYAIGLKAVSDAIDSYNPAKGNFWSYAAVIIKNRLIDRRRATTKYDQEILVSGNVLDGTSDYDDEEYLIQEEVLEKKSISTENNLKLEIEALSQELARYNISFFDLAASSPKAQKTRNKCCEIIKAFFLPPPLLEAMEKKRRFPGTEICKRVKKAKKCVERYKNYLICIVLIIKGDYPGIGEYISYIKDEVNIKDEVKTERRGEHEGLSCGDQR